MGVDPPKVSLIIGVENKPKKLVIYGDSAVGKSSFAAQFPKPVFIQTEEAGGLIESPRFPLSKSFAETIENINTVISGDAGKFDTVVIDSLSGTEALIAKHVCAKLGINGLGDDADYGNSKSYSMANELWHSFKDKLNSITDAGMNVVLTGHVTQRNVKDPRVDEYEKTVIALGKWGKYDPCNLFHCWSDCTLYVAYKVFTKGSDTGIDSTRTTAIGDGTRVVYTEERPAYLAKNRFDMPPELPYKKGAGYKVIEQYLNVTKQTEKGTK